MFLFRAEIKLKGSFKNVDVIAHGSYGQINGPEQMRYLVLHSFVHKQWDVFFSDSLTLCLSVSLFLCLFVCLSLFFSVSLYLFLGLTVSVSVFLSVSLFLCLLTFIFCMFVRTYLNIRQTHKLTNTQKTHISLSLSLSLCLSVSLSLSLSLSILPTQYMFVVQQWVLLMRSGCVMGLRSNGGFKHFFL